MGFNPFYLKKNLNLKQNNTIKAFKDPISEKYKTKKTNKKVVQWNRRYFAQWTRQSIVLINIQKRGVNASLNAETMSEDWLQYLVNAKAELF